MYTSLLLLSEILYGQSVFFALLSMHFHLTRKRYKEKHNGNEYPVTNKKKMVNVFHLINTCDFQYQLLRQF